MSTDELPFPNLRMVTEGRSTWPEPALNQSWDDLTKLRWHAAVLRANTGAEVRVERSTYRVGGIKMPGYFDVSSNNQGWGSGPMRFDAVWTYLNGMERGIATATADRGGRDD